MTRRQSDAQRRRAASGAVRERPVRWRGVLLSIGTAQLLCWSLAAPGYAWDAWFRYEDQVPLRIAAGVEFGISPLEMWLVVLAEPIVGAFMAALPLAGALSFLRFAPRVFAAGAAGFVLLILLSLTWNYGHGFNMSGDALAVIFLPLALAAIATGLGRLFGAPVHERGSLQFQAGQGMLAVFAFAMMLSFAYFAGLHARYPCCA